MEKRKFYIVKIGGNIINDEILLNKFLDDFVQLEGPRLLVHGGGKQLDTLAVKLGHTQQMVNGRRITDAQTLDLALMVYAGLINKKIVAALQARNCNALGLTGADMNVIRSVKRQPGKTDFGLVGDVNAASVNAGALDMLARAGVVPVFSALTHDGSGQMLNTNADSLTCALASALAKLYEVELLYCFDKTGVLRGNDEIIASITRDELRNLVDRAEVNGGMIPKLETAFEAVHAGVKRVVIGHASDLLKNINEEQVRGTSVVA